MCPRGAITKRPAPCSREACSTQATYSAGVSSPIMSVRLRIKVFRFRQLSTRVAIASLLCRRSDLPGHSTPQELAYAFFAEPLGPVDDQLAAQEDLFDPARDRAPFEHRVIHPTVTLGTLDGPGLVGIEQNDIRIGADGDGALAGKQAEQPGRRGGGQLDDAVQRQPVLSDPAVEDRRPRDARRRGALPPARPAGSPGGWPPLPWRRVASAHDTSAPCGPRPPRPPPAPG